MSLEDAQADFELAFKYSMEKGDVDKSFVLPIKAKAYSLHAWASYCLGDFSTAISSYHEAISLQPQMPDYRFFLGKVCFRVGETDRGEESFEVALRKNYIFEERAREDGDYKSQPNSFEKVILSVRTDYLNRLLEDYTRLSEQLDRSEAEAKAKGIIDDPLYQPIVFAMRVIRRNKPGRSDDIATLVQKHTTLKTAVSTLQHVIPDTTRNLERELRELGEELERSEARISIEREHSANDIHDLVKRSNKRLEAGPRSARPKAIVFAGITHLVCFFLVVVPNLTRGDRHWGKLCGSNNEYPAQSRRICSSICSKWILTLPAWGFVYLDHS